jgi:eukaryotic-like serine/threonine-protein kinase
MASVFGKYQLIAQLGEGGMAQVFLAAVAGPRGSGFSKLTVIKRLRASYEDDHEFIAMLVDEARIAARLNHPNVVQTHEVGEIDGKYFLAMEYLDGHSLHRIQNRSRALHAKGETTKGLQRDMAYVIVHDVLAGLHHAHELSDYDGTPLGIVHRDITPPNVFVTYEGQVKVVDFGIAKAEGRGSETRHGVIKGKVRYMAPEQATGKSVDRRADIFACGLLLWEAATGQRRWKEDQEVSIVRALLANEAYVPPENVDPTVAPEIAHMIKRALAFSPSDRYATAEEFRKDLHDYLTKSGELLSGRAKLGPMLAELFKDKREELKQCIEKRLNNISNSEFTPMMLTLHSDADRSGSSRRDISLIGHTASAPQTLSLPQQSSMTTKRVAIIAAATLLGVAAIGIATVKATQGSRRDSSTANMPNVSQPGFVNGDQVGIRISAAPMNAKMFLDGKPIASPYEANVERSAATHTVRIEAEGYEPENQTLTFDRSATFSFSLRAVTSNPAAVAVAAPAAATPAAPPAANGRAGAVAFVPKPASGGGGGGGGSRSGGSTSANNASNSAAAETASSPAPASSPSAATTPGTGTSKFKRDIDKTDPFASSGGSAGPAKTIDKSNPFK